jgi:hypothetical protein
MKFCMPGGSGELPREKRDGQESDPRRLFHVLRSGSQ